MDGWKKIKAKLQMAMKVPPPPLHLSPCFPFRTPSQQRNVDDVPSAPPPPPPPLHSPSPPTQAEKAKKVNKSGMVQANFVGALIRVAGLCYSEHPSGDIAAKFSALCKNQVGHHPFLHPLHYTP